MIHVCKLCTCHIAVRRREFVLIQQVDVVVDRNVRVSDKRGGHAGRVPRRLATEHGERRRRRRTVHAALPPSLQQAAA